jgi:hypothetical protein
MMLEQVKMQELDGAGLEGLKIDKKYRPGRADWRFFKRKKSDVEGKKESSGGVQY